MKRGFTLIELMIVMGIIGVMASIIIVSLNSTRAKGNDAKVKAQLEQVRNAAQIYYDSNGQNYTPGGNAGNKNDCTGPMFTDVQSGMSRLIVSSIYPYGNLTCRHNGGGAPTAVATEFAVSADLSTGKSWCVDTTGFSGEIASSLANNDTTCN